MSDALNAVAEAARVALGKATDVYFDRPVPFTERAFGMFHAHGGPEPEAGVFVMPIQAKYLELEIYGGVRRAGDYATMPDGVLVPARDTPLDAYGNIPRNYVQQQEADPRVSWAVLGPAGGRDAHPTQRRRVDVIPGPHRSRGPHRPPIPLLRNRRTGGPGHATGRLRRRPRGSVGEQGGPRSAGLSSVPVVAAVARPEDRLVASDADRRPGRPRVGRHVPEPRGRGRRGLEQQQ